MIGRVCFAFPWDEAGPTPLIRCICIYLVVIVQVTCRAGESLESVCWRWRPVMGDRLVIQSSGDDGIVLRLYVDSWTRGSDVEEAEKEALKRYRLSAGDRDRVEVVETLQAVGHDGSL